MKTLVSFVIPCYRSAHTLPGVIDEIKGTMKKLNAYDYEVVLINDCSPDDTFEIIKGMGMWLFAWMMTGRRRQMRLAS